MAVGSNPAQSKYFFFHYFFQFFYTFQAAVSKSGEWKLRQDWFLKKMLSGPPSNCWQAHSCLTSVIGQTPLLGGFWCHPYLFWLRSSHHSKMFFSGKPSRIIQDHLYDQSSSTQISEKKLISNFDGVPLNYSASCFILRKLTICMNSQQNIEWGHEVKWTHRWQV